jgi:hypothetical protein
MLSWLRLLAYSTPPEARRRISESLVDELHGLGAASDQRPHKLDLTDLNLDAERESGMFLGETRRGIE